MSLTNYAQLTDEELTVWSRDVWKAARNAQFLNRYTGSGPSAMIQRITELTKTQKGARAVITLVADLEGDGTAGDRTLEGNEEAGKAYDQVIQIDQLRHANRHEGKMADQRSVVNFRTNSRDVLAYWLADRSDQLGFLTMSGVAYTQNTNGTARVGSDFPFLEFAADVTAPSANRHLRWDNASGSLLPGNTAAVVAADKLEWATLVRMKAYAVSNYIKPMRAGLESGEGLEVYNVFVTPQGMADLKLDPEFLKAWREAMPRSPQHKLFQGTDVIVIDGLAIRQFRHVYNTTGATSGVDKWGSGNDVEGQRVIMAGAQAMGYADIGMAEWVEKGFDYDNQQGISVGKIMGMLKPVFRSQYSGTDEDFGVLVVDTAITP